MWEYNYNDHYGGGGNQVARALKYSYDYFDGVYPCISGDLNGDGDWNVLGDFQDEQ